MKTMVKIEISWSDFLNVRNTMKHWASWLEDSESAYDKEARENTLKTLKAIEESAEFITNKD